MHDANAIFVPVDSGVQGGGGDYGTTSPNRGVAAMGESDYLLLFRSFHRIEHTNADVTQENWNFPNPQPKYEN